MAKRKQHSPGFKAKAALEALNEAILKFGVPDDHGSQFTSFVWTDRPRQSGVKISMDGKGRLLDNIFVERRSRPAYTWIICSLSVVTFLGLHYLVMRTRRA